MRIHKILAAAIFVIGITSCNNEQSLQEYYVENQENNEFVAVDIPANMFANMENLNEDQKATLQTIKKVNLIAYPVSNDKEKLANYEAEKVKLAKIFEDEKYQLLMKYGSNNRKAEVYFLGEEDAIDEVLVYGFDDSKGVGVARVLGDKMNPNNIMQLMRSFEKGDLDMSGLQDIFGEMNKEISQQ